MKISLKTLLIRKGGQWTLRAIAYPTGEAGKRDHCPVLAFFEEQNRIHADEFIKLQALLTHTATHGPPNNETKFKFLTGTDGLHEFKTPGGLRLFCFFDEGNLIVCTHGVVKKRNKADPAEIKRAAKMHAEYVTAKKKGELHHVEPN